MELLKADSGSCGTPTGSGRGPNVENERPIYTGYLWRRQNLFHKITRRYAAGGWFLSAIPKRTAPLRR